MPPKESATVKWPAARECLTESKMKKVAEKCCSTSPPVNTLDRSEHADKRFLRSL